ncbi:MAG: hypothetical protein ABIH00_08840 [Armatimonadota bacterium]
MKKLLIALVVIAFLAGAAFAGSTDTQTVYYEIDAINEITFDLDCTLTVDTATAGSQPTQAHAYGEGLDWNITTNCTGKKITGAINVNMPSNTTLTVYLDNSGWGCGSPVGNVVLNTTSQNMITSIGQVAHANNYQDIFFKANVEAGLPSDFSRVITYTLTDE